MAVETHGHGSLIGTTLGGYEVEALIGRGAMGSVYLARDTKLNRHVALKVLLGSLARTPEIVKQFQQEAQAAAPLNHPGIVRIYSAGIEGGTPFIAMEFVDGEPLSRFLQRKGKVSWDLALHIGGQVAQALDCAHRNGVVHRDVKPSNILLDRKGRVRLTDFGIARMQEEGESASNEVIGTPQYMSPEQVTAAEVGPTSDLFALGVTLYHLISGELPFRAESSMGLVKRICEDEPPRLNRLIPSVPDDVARLVAYLMEKDPAGRPANAKVAYGLIHRLHKQRGGVSALHESLSAFLKEEMEPRPFSSLTQRQAEARKRQSTVSRRRGRSRKRKAISWRHAGQIALVLLLAAGALSLGSLNAGRARARSAVPAPELDLATTQSVAPGVERVLFFLEGYVLDDVAWVGGDTGLLVSVKGLRGALTDGASGVLGFDRESKRVLSLGPPVSEVIDPSAPKRVLASRYTIPVYSTAPGSPLHDTFLVLAPHGQNGSAALLAQPWTSGTPHPDILFETPAEFLTWEQPLDRESPAPGPVAVHPAGERVCVLLYDEDMGFPYLAERAIDVLPLTALGPHRTSPGLRLVAGSVQYTPDGGRLAYLARQENGFSELRMLDTGGREVNGQRITGDIVGSRFALSPDGDRVLTVRQTEQGEAEVAVVDSRSGALQAQYGRGAVSKRAWLPGGEGFFFMRGDAPGELVWASAHDPSDQRVVMRFQDGAPASYAVSSNGEHIAVITTGGQVLSLYVVDWERLGAEG